MRPTQLLLKLRNIFKNGIKPMQWFYSLVLGIITSWLIKDGVTSFLLGGRSFYGRSFFIQAGILVLLVVFTSASFFIALSILNSFYARYEKLQPLLEKIIYNRIFQPMNSIIHKALKSILHLEKKAKVLILCFIVVMGFFIGVALNYYRGAYLQLPYPNNTFLSIPSVRFSDYYDVLRDGQSLSPYLEYKSAQYPFLAFLGYLFSSLSISYRVFFLLVSGLFLFFSIHYLRIGTWFESLTPIFVIPFLSYPFLFTVDRGNFEILLFVLLLAFIFFFTRKQYLVSALILSCAIAMKVFPAVMLILFIPEKKYREMIISVGSTILITLISLLFFKGGLIPNLTFLLKFTIFSSNAIVSNFVAINNNWVQRGVSLLTFIKIYYHEIGKLPVFIVNNFRLAYLLLAGIFMTFTTLFVIFIEKETWKRVALLILAMLLLPPISADYKLLYMFIPLYIFLDKKTISKADIFYLLMFGVLLIPKNFFFLQNLTSDTVYYHDTSISVVINFIVMISMALVIVISGLVKNKYLLHSNGFIVGIATFVVAAIVCVSILQTPSSYDFVANYASGIMDPIKSNSPSGQVAFAHSWPDSSGLLTNTITLISPYSILFPSITCEKGSKLFFSAGIPYSNSDGADLSVYVEKEGNEKRIFNDSLEAAKTGGTITWSHYEVPLIDCSTEPIGIKFGASSPSGDNSADWIAIKNANIVIEK